MPHYKWRSFVYVFVILALTTAGISPACQFISGKSDGLVFCHPGMMGDETGDETPHHAPTQRQSTDKPCSFCFSVQVTKDTTAKVLSFSKISGEQSLYKIRLYDEPFVSFRSRIPFENRAPPKIS